MKRTIILLMAVFIASVTVGFGQDDPPELRPSTDPDFERATMTIRPVWDWEEDIVIDGKDDEGFWDQIEAMDLVFDVTDAWWSEGSIPIDPAIKESGDYHLTWKITMDEEFFYIFCDITDDELVSRSMVAGEDEWQNDNIELFFLFADETVVMPDWALGEASQVRVFIDTDEQTADTLTAAGWAGGMIDDPYQPMGYMARTALKDDGTGYTLEARIPLGLIVPTDEDGNFGYFDEDDNWVDIDIREMELFQFDIQTADRDDPAEGEGRKYLHQWSANWNRNWGFTEGYGLVSVGDQIVADDPGDPGELPEEARPTDDPNWERAEKVIRPIWDWEEDIVIDGKADEGFWDHIETMDLVFDVTDAWWVNDVKPIDPEIKESGDYHLTWKVTMDEEFFYIFCDVIDDEFVPRSMVAGEDEWLNDNIELFFLFADRTVVMPDWALGEASQIRIFADTDEQTADTLTAAGWAGGMIDDPYQPMGYMARTAMKDDGTGYTIEARIPLGLIVPTDEDGNFGYFDDDDNWVDIDIREMDYFQFDIQVADRDDPTEGAGRKYLHQWSANWNRNWGFTEGYGILTIGDPIITSVPEVFRSNIRLYPNPASDRLVVDNIEGRSRISIFNLLGQEVFQTVADDSRIDMDIEFLKSGIYIIRVCNDSGSAMVEKFIKK